MHYSLFFPGVGGMDARPHLERCGLADLSRDKTPEVAYLERGPGGKPGLLAVWRTGNPATDPPLAITDTQDWQPCRPQAARGLSAGAYLVGIDRRAPPTPADLARKNQHAGYWFTLGDGREWHIPTASMLPHVHGLAADGGHCRQVSAGFAGFWERSRSYAESIFTALGQLDLLQQLRGAAAPRTITIDVPVADLFALAVEALAFNYRLNAELAARLQLLGDAELRNVLMLIVDLPQLLEHREKKKPADSISVPVGSDISCGVAD